MEAAPAAPDAAVVPEAAAAELAGYVCVHCGASFSSRNRLFKHLAEGCDPSASKGREKEKERVVLVVAYLGSRYHGFACQRECDEASRPTVEGTVLAAARRAWGEGAILAVARSTRTEKGVHAAENVIVLTVQPSTWHGESLRKELQGSEVWLIAPVGLPPPGGLFDKVYAAKKRTYRCYVPYFALLSDEDVREAAENPSPEGVWIGPISEHYISQDIVALLAGVGVAVDTADVDLTPGRGQAEVRLRAGDSLQAQQRLDGSEWQGQALMVLPLAEAHAKFRVQKRVRGALKALRGPPKGCRSFHNFINDARPGDPLARRQLQHCSAGGVNHVLSPAGAGDWREAAWTQVTFSAADFGPGQLRRMAGAVVAVARGTEDKGYIERCFQDAPVPTPLAPVEAISLDSVVIGQFTADWHEAAGLDAAAAASAREEVQRRVAAEALGPWKDFLRSLSAGATRAHLTRDLQSAAVEGDVQRVKAALDAGAPVDAVDEYGRTAAFLAACSGSAEVIKALAARGADLLLPANGGTSPYTAAAARHHQAVLQALEQASAAVCTAGSEGKTAEQYLAGHSLGGAAGGDCAVAASTVTAIIPLTSEHAGAGTTTVDGAFDDAFLDRLEALWQALPRAAQEKASPTERAYFADSEGWVTRRLDAAVAAAGLPGAAEAMPCMRFLHYPEPGGSLPAHVDLSRTDGSGRRSTYSFLLYLKDCVEGGETTFLECIEGDAALAPSGGVAAGPRGTVAAVAPKRGRLLLMPHACPHLAAPCADVPKVLIRGEVLPPRGASSAGQSHGVRATGG